MTTATASGAPAANGWYASDVSVALSAEDNLGGVGVFKTEYSLDNGATWIAYAAQIVIIQEGTTTALYRSEDFVGNIEAAKSLEVKIDRTPPEAGIFWNTNRTDLGIEGIDTASTTVRRLSENTYEITDEAGHALVLTFGKIEKRKRTIEAELKQVTYDGGSLVMLPENELSYSWEVNEKTGELTKLNQKLRIKGQIEVTAKFRRKENETEVKMITRTGEDKKKETQSLSGLRVLTLITNSGKLDYEF